MKKAGKFSIEECEAFAQSNFQNLQLVYNFVEKYKNAITSVLPKPEVGFRDTCIKGLWSRIYFWLFSLNRLNATKDFQAFASANRALLEITVDLSLLHKDSTNSSGWKMHWWGLSEKLKAAEQIVKYFTEQDLEVPNEYSEQKDFIDREKANVLHMRKILWNDKHPNRWTGNGNLFDDLVVADKFLGDSVIELLKMSLTQYYRTEYRKMNWYVHSGVASFWNLPKEAFPLFSAFFLKSCADFAFLSTQIVIKDFGLNAHLPNYLQEVENLNLDRLVTLFQNIESDISKIE